eukprot:3509334-Pyramimonas_sp.AAC.1
MLVPVWTGRSCGDIFVPRSCLLRGVPRLTLEAVSPSDWRRLRRSEQQHVLTSSQSSSIAISRASFRCPAQMLEEA